MNACDDTLDGLTPLEMRRARLRAYADRVLEAVEAIPMPKTFLEAERSSRCIIATDRMLVQMHKTASNPRKPAPPRGPERPRPSRDRFDDDVRDDDEDEDEDFPDFANDEDAIDYLMECFERQKQAEVLPEPTPAPVAQEFAVSTEAVVTPPPPAKSPFVTAPIAPATPMSAAARIELARQRQSSTRLSAGYYSHRPKPPWPPP